MIKFVKLVMPNLDLELFLMNMILFENSKKNKLIGKRKVFRNGKKLKDQIKNPRIVLCWSGERLGQIKI